VVDQDLGLLPVLHRDLGIAARILDGLVELRSENPARAKAFRFAPDKPDTAATDV
jgi:hypothetical protein